MSSAHGVEAVVGPAEGSVTFAGFVALALSGIDGHEVLGLWASKKDEEFALRATFQKMVAGKRIMVVEDILTTGKSAKRVVDATRAAGGDVKMVAALCNRGGVTAEMLGVKWLYPILDFPAESYAPEECPLCAEGVPINTDLGHGKTFLEKQAAAERDRLNREEADEIGYG